MILLTVEMLRRVNADTNYEAQAWDVVETEIENSS